MHRETWVTDRDAKQLPLGVLRTWCWCSRVSEETFLSDRVHAEIVRSEERHHRQWLWDLAQRFSRARLNVIRGWWSCTRCCNLLVPRSAPRRSVWQIHNRNQAPNAVA
eukprot:534195-Rhodomonas_salina.1